MAALRRGWFAVWLCIPLGCASGIQADPDVLNPPEIANPPPRMNFKIGFFMSQADKDAGLVIDGQPCGEVGPQMWAEAGERFTHAFESATALRALPQNGEFDFIIVVERLEATGTMPFMNFVIGLKANFVVHRPGLPSETFAETASLETREPANQPVGRVLSRAVILQFLRKFRAKYR